MVFLSRQKISQNPKTPVVQGLSGIGTLILPHFLPQTIPEGPDMTGFSEFGGSKKCRFTRPVISLWETISSRFGRCRRNPSPIRTWGRMRRDYLKEYHPVLYSNMVLRGTLWTHLADLNEQAQQRLETIIVQMKTAEGVTEGLKARDPLGLGTADE